MMGFENLIVSGRPHRSITTFSSTVSGIAAAIVRRSSSSLLRSTRGGSNSGSYA